MIVTGFLLLKITSFVRKNGDYMTKCQFFSFVDDLAEVSPGALYMQAIVGENLSVGVVNFRLPGGPEIQAKSHFHGEEVTLQVRGGCDVNIGHDVANPSKTIVLKEGSVMIMPADMPHSGVNKFDSEGMCLRLNVVTPPRKEYGTSGSAKPYYPTGDAQ